MPSPTRWPNGITDHAQGNAGMGRFYPQPDPARYHRYFNDFDVYTAGDWTVTETQAGATQAITAGHGGLLALVNSAADDDVNSLQLVQETFKLAATRQAWIRARFKVSDATQSDLLIGLAITDTSPLASLPSDGLYFLKVDGSTSLLASTRLNGTSSSITMGTMANDTFVTAELYYNGASLFTAMLDGVPVGTDITATTNLCDDEELTVTIALQNGDGNARTLTVDFIEVLTER